MASGRVYWLAESTVLGPNENAPGIVSRVELHRYGKSHECSCLPLIFHVMLSHHSWLQALLAVTQKREQKCSREHGSVHSPLATLRVKSWFSMGSMVALAPKKCSREAAWSQISSFCAPCPFFSLDSPKFTSRHGIKDNKLQVGLVSGLCPFIWETEWEYEREGGGCCN